MKKDKRVYIEDILDAIEHIESYIKKGKKKFLKDELVQDAIIRRIAVIGEAVKNLSPSVRKMQPDIPWKQIAGMRDILVHDYSETDIEEVWHTVKKDLPPLKKAAKAILKEMQR